MARTKLTAISWKNSKKHVQPIPLNTLTIGGGGDVPGEQEHEQEPSRDATPLELLLQSAATDGHAPWIAQVDQHFTPEQQRSLTLVSRGWRRTVLARTHNYYFSGGQTSVRWCSFPHELVRSSVSNRSTKRARQAAGYDAADLQAPPVIYRMLPLWLGALRALEVTGDLHFPRRPCFQVTDCTIRMPSLPVLDTLVLDLRGFHRLHLRLGHLPALRRLGLRMGLSSMQVLLGGCAGLRHMALRAPVRSPELPISMMEGEGKLALVTAAVSFHCTPSNPSVVPRILDALCHPRELKHLFVHNVPAAALEQVQVPRDKVARLLSVLDEKGELLRFLAKLEE